MRVLNLISCLSTLAVRPVENVKSLLPVGRWEFPLKAVVIVEKSLVIISFGVSPRVSSCLDNPRRGFGRSPFHLPKKESYRLDHRNKALVMMLDFPFWCDDEPLEQSQKQVNGKRNLFVRSEIEITLRVSKQSLTTKGDQYLDHEIKNQRGTTHRRLWRCHQVAVVLTKEEETTSKKWNLSLSSFFLLHSTIARARFSRECTRVSWLLRDKSI